MKVVKTHLSGCVMIEPQVFGDQRGFFLETFQARRYAELAGIDLPFVRITTRAPGGGCCVACISR